MSRLHELSRKYPRYGYRMMRAKLRQEGWRVNVKRVYRLWRQEGLKVPKKTRKKRRLGHSATSVNSTSATDNELTDDDLIVRYEDGEIVGITILYASQR